MCRYHLLLGTFCIFLVSACKDPYDYRIPREVAHLDADEGFKQAVLKLKEEDRPLLVRYMMRAGLAQAFGQGSSDRTIRQALDDQRRTEAENAVKETEAKALAERVQKERATATKAMNEILVVAMTHLQYHDADYMKGVDAGFSVGFAFQNKSSRDLAGVKGTIRFADIFDDEIRTVSLSVDDGIGAGETLTWRGGFDYNRFRGPDKKLRSTAVDKLRVSWIPETYLFADGSRMDVSQ